MERERERRLMIFSRKYFVINIIIINRRVHITEETLQHLNGAYEVEEGDGGSRDPLLTGRETYLVIDPHKLNSISRRPKSVHMFVKCMYRVSSMHIYKMSAPEGQEGKRNIYFFC